MAHLQKTIIPNTKAEQKECIEAKNDFSARMMSMDQWGNGDLASDSNSDFLQ